MIFNIINKYEENRGVGIDQYFNEEMNHPMADGKYLSALSVLFSNKKVSKEFYQLRVSRAIKRLEKSSSIKNDEHAAWGLNFKYKSIKAKEPYLITSSIVLKGLLDNQEYMPLELVKRTVNYLNEYPYFKLVNNKKKIIVLPQFSENTIEYNYNAVAYWAAMMYVSSKEGLIKDASISLNTLEYIKSLYEAPYGWRYSAVNNRVDLLHQFYILNSLLEKYPIDVVERVGFDVINSFYSDGKFHDKLDTLTFDDSIKLVSKVNAYSLNYLSDEKYYVVYDKGARIWSLGEVLVFTSKLMKTSNHPDYWRRISFSLVKDILEKYSNYLQSNISPRDDMHILDGLANFWVNL